MSQVSDVSIANQGFSAFRTELNNILGALNSMHSGTSRPASATTGTIWLDTTNSGSNSLEIKFFDGSDDISFATVNTSANTINFIDSTVSFDIVSDTSPQLGGNLDTNSQNILIDDAHFIGDENGNEQIIFQTTASAVNQLDITNAATGNAPEISATGGDTNIDLKLTPKGSGKLNLDGIKFPNADGSANQFLKTDGSGNLSFDAAGGITMADQWRLTSDFTGNADPITSNLSQASADGGGGIGSSMTVSSGVFTFPSTGIYLILAHFSFSRNANDRLIQGHIQAVTDAGSGEAGTAFTFTDGGYGDSSFTSTDTQFLFDVTNVSTHKVKFGVFSGGATCIGDADSHKTGFTFIRLGDT